MTKDTDMSDVSPTNGPVEAPVPQAGPETEPQSEPQTVIPDLEEVKFLGTGESK